MALDAHHLNAATAELLLLSGEERIRAIRADRWTQYPRARHALTILRHVLDHPRTTRMPSVAIYGDSGMGKTMIMERFRLDHPPDFDLETGSARIPVPFTLPRWSANQEFEDLIRAALRNLPLRQPSVLTAKSLRHILHATQGLTAGIFTMLNAFAIAAIENGREQITDDAILQWAPLIRPEAAYS